MEVGLVLLWDHPILQGEDQPLTQVLLGTKAPPWMAKVGSTVLSAGGFGEGGGDIRSVSSTEAAEQTLPLKKTSPTPP